MEGRHVGMEVAVVCGQQLRGHRAIAAIARVGPPRDTSVRCDEPVSSPDPSDSPETACVSCWRPRRCGRRCYRRGFSWCYLYESP